MRSEASASFELTGDSLDPDDVTLQTGILPSRSRRAGDLVDSLIPLRSRVNRWSVKSRLPRSANLRDHVADVFAQLRPGWRIVLQLSSRYAAEISCEVWSYGGARPSVNFDQDMVRDSAALGADISIDLYVVDDEGTE